MGTGEILRIIMISAGVLLLMETILSLAKRKLNEQFCLLWTVISLCLIVAGIILEPHTLGEYISGTGIVIVIIVAGCVGWCMYFLSTQVSLLNRKNQELAMQVSLLNQENKRILSELENKMEDSEEK